MARIGVSYQDVAKAAAQISQTGKTPTVDAVRALLGTGSKSTLSPFLKQWKAKQGESTGTETLDIPSDLIVSVKALYDGIKKQADERIETIQGQTKAEIEEIKSKASDIKKTNEDLQLQLSADEASIKKLTQLNTALHNSINKEQQAHTTLKTQHDALLQRLEDRNKEIEKLNAHLQQTQANLDHYRDTTQKQREQERSDFTQQRLAGEQSLKQSQQQNQQLREHLGQLETKVTQQTVEFKQLQTANSQLNQQQKQQSEDILKAQWNLTNLTGRYDMAQETLAAAQLKTKMQDDQIVQLEKRTAVSQDQASALTLLNEKIDYQLTGLRDENMQLKQEKAKIEGRFDQLQQAYKLANTDASTPTQP